MYWLLFVIFEMLSRNQGCRFWSLQIIRIMQSEMLNVAVLNFDASEAAVGDDNICPAMCYTM
jgi:hypothetical protein